MSEVSKEEAARKRVKEVIPLKGVRKIVAEHVLHSLQVSAQLTTMGMLDMTEMIKLRQTLLSQEEATGIHFTYTDLFVKVVAQALKQHPLFNSSLIDGEIRIWEDINIGVALAFELRGGGRGLISPIVRNADKKSLVEIHQTLRDLVEKGRNLKLLPDDVADGTFSISNVGVFGKGSRVSSRFATPILNQPEVGLLATWPIVDTPVVREGQIVIRPMMNYSLTYDHRVVVGEDVNSFLITVQQLMEEPSLLLLS